MRAAGSPRAPASSSGPGSGSGSAAGFSGAAGVAEPSPTTASSAPTSTVSSSETLISSSVPATGEGISVSTLSVETSSSGSSTATSSPTCFSQRVTVPSVTDSPRAGRVTGVPEPPELPEPLSFDAATGSDEVSSSAGSSWAGSGSAGVSAWAGSAGCSGSESPPEGASSSSPISASTAPTSTVSSSLALISSSVPATGEGISVSTLSVETSSNGSSTATVSPTCFSHCVTVPSVTDSPRAGRVTSVAMAADLSFGLRGVVMRRSGRTSDSSPVSRARATACRPAPGGPRPAPRSGWGARAPAVRRPRRGRPSRR